MAKATGRRPALAGASYRSSGRILRLHSGAECGILTNGDIRLCFGVQVFGRSLPTFRFSNDLVLFRSILAMLKQVTGPATLRFERRARRVKCATSGKHWNSVTARGTKGRRLSSVSLSTKQRAISTRSPGSMSRGALSPSLRKHRLGGHARPDFPPRRVLRWGSLNTRNRCHHCEERQHRIRRRAVQSEGFRTTRFPSPSTRHDRHRNSRATVSRSGRPRTKQRVPSDPSSGHKCPSNRREHVESEQPRQQHRNAGYPPAS